MPASNGFSKNELDLIMAVKKTLKIMAKVIEDRNPGEVIKDIDPYSVSEDKFVGGIIKKINFLEKLKDFDPDSESENDNLAILIDELTNAIKEEDPSQEIDDKKLKTIIRDLTQTIRERITPDLPCLNPKDEGVILGHLGPSVFAYMTRKGGSMNEFDNMFSIPVEPMTALTPGQSRDLSVKEGMKVIITDVYIENYGDGISYFEILEKTGSNTFEMRYRFRTLSDQTKIIGFNTGVRLGEERSALDSIRIQNSTDSRANIIARVNGIFVS
jgi:hypothetical protein